MRMRQGAGYFYPMAAPQFAGYHGPVYDGFGNPVGAFPLIAALAPLAKSILPAVLPAAGSLIQKILPGMGPAPAPAPVAPVPMPPAEAVPMPAPMPPPAAMAPEPVPLTPPVPEPAAVPPAIAARRRRRRRRPRLAGMFAGMPSFAGVPYGATPVYDGLGNPVGLFPGLISKITSLFSPRPAAPPPLPVPALPIPGPFQPVCRPCAPCPPCPPFPRPGMPGSYPGMPVPGMPGGAPIVAARRRRRRRGLGEFGDYAEGENMLAQDPTTGMLHEVPSAPVYDGFGNPVGELPWWFWRHRQQQMQPPGWIRPNLPYTGQHQRMYLRCAAWPGPPGMVPAFAQQPGAPGQMPGMPGMPGAPGMPGMPGFPGGFPGIRRRRRRR